MYERLIVILLVALIAAVLLGFSWLMTVAHEQIAQWDRRRIARLAAELVLQHPEYLARVVPLLPGMLERFPAEMPALEEIEYAIIVEDQSVADSMPQIEQMTGAIPVEVVVDPYSHISATVQTAPRAKLEAYAADLERQLHEAQLMLADAAETVRAVESDADLKITAAAATAARKDRTRARYLRRLRRVDAVLAHAGGITDVFAALHPTLARAA